MNKLNVKDLKDGMVFSESLLSETGEQILLKGSTMKRDDIKRWVSAGILTVYTQGELIAGQENEESELDIVRKKLRAQKNDIPQTAESESSVKTSQAAATKEELLKATIYESRLACLEVVEQVTDALSLGLTLFLQNPAQIDVFRTKLVIASESLVSGIRKYPGYYVDMTSFAESGNVFVSHSVRVAILGIFLGIQLDCGYKRLLAIAMASFLHDIGKVSHSIVNSKEGVTVSKERMNIRLTHPIYGYKIAKSFLKLQEECCQAILNHHEQSDGKGFPRRVTDIKLFVTDKIIYISNLFAHLIEKNRLEGYYTPLQNLEYLLQNFPDKFDHRIAQKFNELKNMKSYNLLHIPPPLEEGMTDTQEV